MRLIFATALAIVSATLAHAETMEVRPGKPVASFTLPDEWETTRTNRGIQVKTDDDDVYIWVETYRPEELKTIVSEHNAYWDEQGVKITGRDLSEHVENGVSVQVVSEKATWEGKPTVLLYMEYDLALPSKSNILITYWASPEGHDTYSKDVKSIIGSMTVTEK